MSTGGPTVRDHVSACGLEMISLFALLYFLKTLLHFDVFGQSLHQVARQEQLSEKNSVKQEVDIVNDVKEVKEAEDVEDVEEDGVDEDEDYNEDTVEKSYSVSSWSCPGSAQGRSEEEEGEEGEEEETDITNVTGDSRGEEEEIIDEIPADYDGPDRTQISEDQDESRDEIECESDSDPISDCEAIYSTDWYNHYKQIIKQKSPAVTANDPQR